MATVPSAYIKDKEVDYEREIFAILGEGFRVGHFHFRPPVLGVWALWEILDSPVIKGSEDATIGDYLRLLWVNDVRQCAVGHLAQWCDAGKPDVNTDCELNVTVMQWAETVPAVLIENTEYMLDIADQISLCYTGYDTIPSSGGNSGQWLFAGEAFGPICASSPEHSETMIWHTPMTLHGHIAAHIERANGATGVGRPKDPEDIKLQLKLANEREKAGKLHEWQELEPLAFPLSAEQCKHPNLVARFEALCQKARGK